MSLSTLPAVLVQSLMHSLQAKEILSLARCCRWTLECADSSFAWRDCPPLLFRFHENLIVPPSSARLSRWLPIALSSNVGTLSVADADQLLQLLHSFPRIIRLHWMEWKLSVERGLELLSHPSMQSVSDVGLAVNIHAEWLAAAALLPSLTSVDLVGSCLSAADLQPLVHARALRQLFVSGHQCESVVQQLTQLTRLSIYAPRLNGTSFAAFSAAMSGLEELRLMQWRREDIRSISSADLSAGLASLRCLRTLQLGNLFDVETLAPVLHLAPALRVLRLSGFKPAHELVILGRMQRVAPLLQVQFD